MRTIQNAMRRFFIILNLHTIKDALLRVCRKQKPAIVAAEPVVELPPMAEEIFDDDTVVNERFVTWEDDRSETLQQAGEYERQALQLLSRAALLRTVVRCDDRGDSFLANELRVQVEDVPMPESASNHPTLRLVTADETPIECGA